MALPSDVATLCMETGLVDEPPYGKTVVVEVSTVPSDRTIAIVFTTELES